MRAYEGWQSLMNWYDNSPADEIDYQMHQFVKNIPFLGWYLDARDNSHKMNDYLSNRGLDYSDIRYNQAPYGRTYGSAQAQATSAIASLYGRSARSGGRGRPRQGYRHGYHMIPHKKFRW